MSHEPGFEEMAALARVLEERVRVDRVHRAVRGALEQHLTSRHFLVGVRVHARGTLPPLAQLADLARRVDAWLSSVDPDTSDATELSLRVNGPEVGVEVHAIPKDPCDCAWRSNPIVWNPHPVEHEPGIVGVGRPRPDQPLAN